MKSSACPVPWAWSATKLAVTPQRAAKMILLSKAQLAFERVGRKVVAFPTCCNLRGHRPSGKIEEYLHKLITEWEDKGPSLAAPTTPDNEWRTFRFHW
jgi:hypothetical protein